MTLAVPSPTLVTSVTRVTPGKPPWIPTLPTPWSIDPASPLGDLLSRLNIIPAELVQAIEATRRPIVEPEIAAKSAMLERFTRLLDHVGDAGITLTQAGCLPPAHVHAVAAMLRLEDIWIGKNNREVTPSWSSGRWRSDSGCSAKRSTS